MSITRRIAAASLCAIFVAPFATAPSAAATVRVIVNGQAVAFDQPPIERAGRVFVPLRGVFQQLGATVVYANGVINATGPSGQRVHLTIGSREATVNGQTVYTDVAPFLVGARTLVPLRFVAQSLGAVVNWIAANNTVTIAGGGSSAVTPVTPANASFTLINKRPAGTARTTEPSIHAAFSEAVNRDTLRVAVDGRDVSASTEASTSSFTVVPPFALAPGKHTVAVTGTTAAGATFNTGWSFTVASGATSNVLNNISPAEGSTVGSSFTVTGHTRPGAAVHLAATASATAFGIIPIGTGTFQADATADGAGDFSIPVNINTAAGGRVTVIVTSTEANGAAATRTLTYTAS